ncbi:MAG: dehydrogenase [Planctomycetes bacterium]|jgi:predicted dehydrogenase|nr:dehydrogenase [Planctomycetota bacterium]MDP6409994.1 Gfo/Idh/MocA family oxidoreductase [Planctomycetota bacterium]
MSPLSRRQFVQGSTASVFALSLPALATPKPRRRSPNEEIRCAVIGFRSRGRSHINGLHALQNVSVVALCDVDSEVLAKGAKRFSDRGESVDTYTDLRRVMDRDDIDVIATATPNHWHALITIWACQTGKDVYVEKPVSHNVWEGRQMVRAAREHGRVVQTGTQSRSSQAIGAAAKWIQKGNLGEITVAHGLCYKPRKSIGKVESPQDPPANVDYGLWCGPRPARAQMRRNLHYDWHWVFDYGNGDVGNQGIHQMDICRWVMGERAIAPRVLSIGGRFGYEDDGNTPNTEMVFHQYEKAPLIFEVRGLPRDKAAQVLNWGGSMDNFKGARIGAVIQCEGGRLLVPNYSSAKALDNDGNVVNEWSGASNHFANFIDAVRARNPEDLTADIEEGHVSSALCHMGNASHLLGSAASPEEARERLAGNAQAADSFDRLRGHLSVNGVDIAEDEVTLGAYLEYDPRTEECTSHSRANRLFRDYRPPFEVPERV